MRLLSQSIILTNLILMPTLPSEFAAHAAALAALAAATTAAQDAFVASTTVLIVDAIALGRTFVQPFMAPLVTSDFVTTYFQALGYTVLFPIVSSSPFDPAFVPGFPEVLPPGYQFPGQTLNGSGPPRIQISWSS